MWGEDITARTDEIGALLAERLGARGATLAERLARVQRLLPRRLRREARFLAGAETMAANPRLARLVDPDRLARAHGAVQAHLAAVNPRERRLTRALGIVAVIAFDLLALAVLVVVVLRWRGFL
ncbi:MAG: hypothetical protein H3C51_09025 [Rubellimicrobium sp.]|nr:hypothetical protein [Rubellimicrobium sp.]